MLREFVEVDGVLYRRYDWVPGEPCPFCGGTKMIVRPADETFMEQTGCLECDRWLQPVRLLERKRTGEK